MCQEHWRSWDEIEAQAAADGRLDENAVAARTDHLRTRQRAYRLAEIRKARELTQSDLAQLMGVSQRRVSAMERGELSRSELATLISYVTALGGQVELVADFGDERLIVG